MVDIGIHRVKDIKISMLMPANANSLTIEVTAEDDTLQLTLFNLTDEQVAKWVATFGLPDSVHHDNFHHSTYRREFEALQKLCVERATEISRLNDERRIANSAIEAQRHRIKMLEAAVAAIAPAPMIRSEGPKEMPVGDFGTMVVTTNKPDDVARLVESTADQMRQRTEFMQEYADKVRVDPRALERVTDAKSLANFVPDDLRVAEAEGRAEFAKGPNPDGEWR